MIKCSDNQNERGEIRSRKNFDLGIEEKNEFTKLTHPKQKLGLGRKINI